MSTFKFGLKAVPAFAILLLLGCQKQINEQAPHQKVQNTAVAGKAMPSNGSTTREICFTAIAEVAGCIGENIKFGGIVELRENTVTSSSGVHYTRHWTVKDATGMGVRPGGTVNNASTLCPRPYTGVATGTQYDVIAGQEMFSVKDPNTTVTPPSAVLSGDVYIHQGTIVFVNKSTGERHVVRHVIIKNPGQGIHKSGWYMQGENCTSMTH